MPHNIVITGPESTGKSAATKVLCLYYKAPCVDEYARHYLDELSREYVENDLHLMAKGQLLAAQKAIANATTLVIHDTDLLTFIIWWEVKYGHCPQEWVDAWKQNLPSLYLLMDIDLPWEEDPLREHPNRREELMDRYKEKLNSVSVPFKLISGNKEARKLCTLNAVSEFLKHNTL